jgi:ferric-dicitrate binding protein FerR (iron transport regulator)
LITFTNGVIYAISAYKGEESSFIIETGIAKYQVIGTKYFLKASSQEDYLCVCEGEVKASAGIYGEAALRQGDDLHLYLGKPLGPPLPSPSMVDMINPVYADMLKTNKYK